MPSARRRGQRTQDIVAEYWRVIWPDAEGAPSGVPGRDVLKVPVSIEVRSRVRFDPFAWIKDARKRIRPADDELPAMVIMRPPKLGEHPDEFLVFRRQCDDRELVRELLGLRAEVARLRGERASA